LSKTEEPFAKNLFLQPASLLLNNSEKPFDFKGFFRAFAAAGSGYIFRRLSVYIPPVFPSDRLKAGLKTVIPAL